MPLIVLVGQVPPPFHGQAVMIRELLDGLVARGLPVVHVPMDFSKSVDDNGVFSFRKMVLLGRMVRHVRKLLRNNPASILYYPPAPGKWIPVLRDFIFLFFCRRHAGKVVFHFHAFGLGMFLRQHPWLRRPWMNPEVAVVLGPSARVDAEIIQARRIYEIPYGRNITAPPRRMGVETKIPKTFRILFVGHHVRSKGVFDILETARILAGRGADFEIRMVGGWLHREEQERFLAYRHDYGLDGRIACAGPLHGDALMNEYAGADLFFFPTFFENETFGLVLLEAMAFGLPLVASNWRGPVDIVAHGENGYLCEVHDVKAYADRIQEIMCDGALRKKLSDGSIRLYKDQYAAKYFIRAFEMVFTGLNANE